MSPEWSYTMDQSRLSNISGTTYWMALFFHPPFRERAVRGLHWSSCIMSSFLFQIHLLKLSAHRAYFISWGFYLGALRKQCQ